MRVMRSFCFLMFLLVVLSGLSVLAQSVSTPYESVDPFIGTNGGGNTFPGATLPFGMVQWSPDTNIEAWYYHSDKRLHGFSLTHVSGAGCPLYGDFAVLPTADPLTVSPGVKFPQIPFDQRDEKAHPGYYAVKLASGVRVELTVSERAGIARFTFPEGTPSRLLINAGSSVNTITKPSEQRPSFEKFGNEIELNGADTFNGSTEAGEFCGSDSNYKLYVAGQFSKPYKTSALWKDDAILASSKSAQGKHTGAWLDFGDEKEVILKVGISFVSQSGALKNLTTEISGWDFNQVHDGATTIWSNLLDRIAVEGGTADQRKIFYTGLYHSFLSPNIFSDEDGQYIGFDDKMHSLSSGKQKTQYANFSDWDIYRNTVQLQALFEPQRESDMMQSLVNDAEQSGWYPRWPAANDVTYVMGGDSPVILLASSYAFGAHDFDVETAFKYMVKAGTQPGMGPHQDSERPFLAEYLRSGYAPVDKDRIAASRTLEYASADFAIAQFARNIGRDSEYKSFLKQSENWKSLVDPETHWIRPRNGDGTWLVGFDPERSLPKRPNAPVDSDQQGFEEGNTYQYSFMVPFDYPALFAAMGGASTNSF